MGFRFEIGFIDYFNARLVNTLNYSAITDLQNLQITIENAKSFQSVTVSTSCFPVTASNSGDSLASALTSLSAGSQLHRLSLLFTDFLSCSAGILVIQLFCTDRAENTASTVPLLLRVNSLPWERRYFVIVN
jgi:hypothetical protein